MGATPPAVRFLRALDADVARAIGRRGRVVVAFSGGLASLVLVALARKRCEVACEVIGLPGSADAESAAVAEKFLDYPVRVVRPAPGSVLRLARAIASRAPAMTAADVLSVVPMVLVRGRHPRTPILSGFGLTWGSHAVRSFLASEAAALPGFRVRATAAPSRARLQATADLLGLPESFSRAARRRPAEGSGVGPAIRALAHMEEMSVERLLRPRTSRRDYQKRPVTTLIPKSLHLD